MCVVILADVFEEVFIITIYDELHIVSKLPVVWTEDEDIGLRGSWNGPNGSEFSLMDTPRRF